MVLAGLMLLVALAERDIFGGEPAIVALRYTLGLAVFAAVLIGFTVLLFGRPRSVIPPAARSNSGLLARRTDPR